MSERPYTEKQLRMIEVKKKLKTPKELDFLRRMLLPRTKYVPEKYCSQMWLKMS